MPSEWLCSRNDAIGNIAVMAAALGVFGTGSAWPDPLVAIAMSMAQPCRVAVDNGTQCPIPPKPPTR